MNNIFKIRSIFFNNLLSVGFASVISRLISLIILGYPARILGPANYGVYSLGLSITAYGSILILPGLNTWGSRKIAISNSNIDRTIIIVNLTRLLLALISYFLVLLYVSFFIDSQITRLVVLICALNLFSLALSTEWIFNGLELMRIPAFVGMIISFLNVIFIYLLIKTPDDLILYAYFIPTFTFIINIILVFLLVKRGIKFKFPTINYYKLSLKSSFYLSITSAIAIVIHYANNFIVNYYMGPKVLGIFMAAFFLLELITMLPVLIGSVFQSKLTREYHISRQNAISILKSYAFFHLLIGIFITAVVFSEADFIIGFIYDSRYSGSAVLLKYMSIGILFNFLIMGYTNSLISLKVDRVIFFVVSASAIVSIFGGLFFVPKFGEIGASIIISTIDLVGWLISLPFYIRNVGSLELRKWIRPLLGGVFVIILSHFLKMLGTPVILRLFFLAIIYSSVISNYLFQFIKNRRLL